MVRACVMHSVAFVWGWLCYLRPDVSVFSCMSICILSCMIGIMSLPTSTAWLQVSSQVLNFMSACYCQQMALQTKTSARQTSRLRKPNRCGFLQPYIWWHNWGITFWQVKLRKRSDMKHAHLLWIIDDYWSIQEVQQSDQIAVELLLFIQALEESVPLCCHGSWWGMGRPACWVSSSVGRLGAFKRMVNSWTQPKPMGNQWGTKSHWQSNMALANGETHTLSHGMHQNCSFPSHRPRLS
jgi:hypothetical protein